MKSKYSVLSYSLLFTLLGAILAFSSCENDSNVSGKGLRFIINQEPFGSASTRSNQVLYSESFALENGGFLELSIQEDAPSFASTHAEGTDVKDGTYTIMCYQEGNYVTETSGDRTSVV